MPHSIDLSMENKYVLEDELLRGAYNKHYPVQDQVMQQQQDQQEEEEEEEEEEEQQQHPFEGLMFAAMVGSAALVMAMLLFRRALLVSLLEQWRFLAINLLFLAIISLTSGQKFKLMSLISTNCTGKRANQTSDELYSNSHMCYEDVAVEEKLYCQGKAVVVGGDKAVEGYGEMSKEELNIRAEAFIAMFRKQLVSDIAKSHTKCASQRVGFVN